MSIATKDCIMSCIDHISGEDTLDITFMLDTLTQVHDHVQLTSVVNAMDKIARFGMVDVAVWVVHSRIHSLQVQTAKAVFDQNDIGKVERLLAHQSLFDGQLTSVIVDLSRRS